MKPFTPFFEAAARQKTLTTGQALARCQPLMPQPGANGDGQGRREQTTEPAQA